MAANKKILVVEDNEDNREIFVFRLRQLGFEVMIAANGKEALDIASLSKPDLVFMDLRMPVMDGWEATRALRQTDWGKDLPIVAVTAHAMAGEREKAMTAGCCDFITKPTDYDIIQQAIKKFSR